MTETTEEEVVRIIEWPSLAAALAAFQAEVPTIRKGNTATVASQKGSYQYAYADLSDVTEKALPLLGKHGLAFTSKPTLTFAIGGEQTFVMEYALRHAASDESIEGMYPLPDPQAVSPQALGSALTYARRYCLCAVTGVAPGGDDDDAHAQGDQPAQSPRRQQQRPPRQDPARRTPDEPLPVPKVSRDWTVPAMQATTYEELKAVHEEADRLGELALAISGDGETVEQMLKRRKGFLRVQAEKAAEAPAGEAQEEAPGKALRKGESGETPRSRDWLGEARAATSRADLQNLVTEAAEAGVIADVLQEMAGFEDSLPAAEGDVDWDAAARETDPGANH